MDMQKEEELELSVIMPCKDEALTIGICIDEARRFMEKNQIKGEVLVVDNASVDASGKIAREHGAVVIDEPEVGYGNALRRGIQNSRGSVLILGDCDTTYDFLHMEEMYELLAQKRCDMVIGNRYAGGMEKGSMSWSHRQGVRFLSFCGRLRYRTKVYDFHCGLRGVRREAAVRLDLVCSGMEFATEMIAKAVMDEQRILQVPVTLRCCKFNRKSKLRTIRDGLRHLIYIAIFS